MSVKLINSESFEFENLAKRDLFTTQEMTMASSQTLQPGHTAVNSFTLSDPSITGYMFFGLRDCFSTYGHFQLHSWEFRESTNVLLIRIINPNTESTFTDTLNFTITYIKLYDV